MAQSEDAYQMAAGNSGPTRTGYVIAAIVFVLGVIGGAALIAVFAFGLIGLGDDLERVVVPGSQQVELAEEGTYTIFYEHRSRVDGVEYATSEQIPGLDIEITRIEDGEQIPVRSASLRTDYELWNHAGESIRRFDVDQPGEYEISAQYVEGQDGPEIVLAIGEGIGRSILTSVGAFFGAGIVFCMMTLLAIGIAGVTLLRRYQRDQAVRAASSSQDVSAEG